MIATMTITGEPGQFSISNALLANSRILRITREGTGHYQTLTIPVGNGEYYHATAIGKVSFNTVFGGDITDPSTLERIYIRYNTL